MKENKRNLKAFKSNKGITLVALVVTIVVLLILAGVTITILFGDSGIIGSAERAKDAVDEGLANDQIAIENLEDQMTLTLGKPVTKKGHIIADLTAIPADETEKETKKGYKWTDLQDVAKAISKEDISSDIREITLKVGDKLYTVGIGDTATVYYEGEAKTVRLIGFNHDTVVNSTTYGASKAGMTFEFLDFLGTKEINAPDEDHPYGTNEGGWVASEIRAYLSGEVGKIKDKDTDGTAIGIVQVKKDYILKYDEEATAQTEDYLWLLSCSEIWQQNSSTDTKYAYAMAKEGNQYAYYADVTKSIAYNTANKKLKKPNTKSADYWWLRSPYYLGDFYSCLVVLTGYCYVNFSGDTSSVAPGFCI